MKELKKLSLKNEIDKEARKTDEEIRNRHDLDDITVSDDLETSLFNKIQDYEYDKRFQKTIRRSRKKRRILLAVAAIAHSHIRKRHNRDGEQVVLEGADGQTGGG